MNFQRIIFYLVKLNFIHNELFLKSFLRLPNLFSFCELQLHILELSKWFHINLSLKNRRKYKSFFNMKYIKVLWWLGRGRFFFYKILVFEHFEIEIKVWGSEKRSEEEVKYKSSYSQISLRCVFHSITLTLDSLPNCFPRIANGSERECSKCFSESLWNQENWNLDKLIKESFIGFQKFACNISAVSAGFSILTQR